MADRAAVRNRRTAATASNLRSVLLASCYCRAPGSASGCYPWRNELGGKSSTGARNRYPRRGTVSTNRGAVAESPNASRTLLIAVLSPRSNSTKVSAGQSLCCSSSRVTTDRDSRAAASGRGTAVPAAGPSGRSSGVLRLRRPPRRPRTGPDWHGLGSLASKKAERIVACFGVQRKELPRRLAVAELGEPVLHDPDCLLRDRPNRLDDHDPFSVRGDIVCGMRPSPVESGIGKKANRRRKRKVRCCGNGNCK